MSSSNLKQYYMNDVALLQFSTLYISLLLFNEVSTNLSSEKDVLLWLNTNMQQFVHPICSSQEGKKVEHVQYI